MLENYLKETYGYNEPIFVNELKFDEMTDNALRQCITRLVKSGQLVRYDTGIYYFPKKSRILKKSYLNPTKVIIRKYIQNDFDTFGYFTGAIFAHQIGLTTQMPATLEIVTNKEATNGRTVTVGNQTIRIKRPTIEVTPQNATLLQFLDCVNQAEKYSERSLKETIQILINYVSKNAFTQEDLSSAVPAMTGNTAKKLIEWRIIYAFT